MKRVFISTAVFLLLSGCVDKDGQKQSETNEIDISISTLTPQGAVESWWKVKEVVAQSEYQECLAHKKLGSLDHIKDKITHGELLASISTVSCNLPLYERSIDRVDDDGESAVVHVSIKNVTPTVDGVVLSYDELAKKVSGENFRYSLKNVGDSTPFWKIVQIYDQLPSSGSWYPVYSVPSIEKNHLVFSWDQ